MPIGEDSPEERRRRQTENARARQGLPPLPSPLESITTPQEQVQLAAVPREQVPVQGQQQQGGGDTAAKLETLTRNTDKLTRDVAEILAIVKSIQANPPYAMLG